jgi:hypothetical protein
MPQDLQSILSKHQVVLSTPQGLPPSCGVHDHSIPFIPGSLPPNIHPYEIEKMVQELFNIGVIFPSTSPYSSPMVMVLKKEDSWRCVLTFAPSTNLPLKTNFPFMSLMTSWMN